MSVVLYLNVLSVVTYDLPSFAGQLSKADKGRLDNLFRKALRRRVCSQSFTIDNLISAADKKLFRQITSNNNHCLHSLLPPKRHAKALNSLRSCGHIYQLPQIESNLIKNSFFNTSLFSYV